MKCKSSPNLSGQGNLIGVRSYVPCWLSAIMTASFIAWCTSHPLPQNAGLPQISIWLRWGCFPKGHLPALQQTSHLHSSLCSVVCWLSSNLSVARVLRMESVPKGAVDGSLACVTWFCGMQIVFQSECCQGAMGGDASQRATCQLFKRSTRLHSSLCPLLFAGRPPI